MNLTNRTAIVTGAASGIGRATAEALADAGCHVVAVDIDETGLASTRDSIADADPDRRVATRIVDVSDAGAVDDLADWVADEFGAVDVLVNNAGINVTGSFREHTLEDFERTFGVNVWGVIHGCRSFFDLLERAEAGHIVNISSMFGIVGVARQSAYSTSKFAVRGFSESLHEELADTPMNVTVVHPGCIDTAILDDATFYDDDLKDGMQQFFADNGCPPRRVADRIVEAVRNQQHRVVITPESRLGDLFRRIAPTTGNRLANWLMSKFLS